MLEIGCAAATGREMLQVRSTRWIGVRLARGVRRTAGPSVAPRGSRQNGDKHAPGERGQGQGDLGGDAERVTVTAAYGTVFPLPLTLLSVNLLSI